MDQMCAVQSQSSLIDRLELLYRDMNASYSAPRVVSDLMTRRVEALTLDHSVKAFLTFMQANRVRHAPIVDYPNGRRAEPVFIGVVSQRDVLRIGAADLGCRLPLKPDPRALRQLMSRVVTRDAITVEPRTPTVEGIRLMIDNRIDMIPVIEQTHVVGIVTTTDILRMMVRTAEAIEAACLRQTRQKDLNVWAGGDVDRSFLAAFAGRTAEMVMARNLITLNADHTLGVAKNTLQENELRHVPIVNGQGQIVGIVSDRDILRNLPFQGRQRSKVNGKFREDLFRYEGATGALEIPIVQFMTKRLICIEPNSRAIDAARIILKKKIGTLPVTDSNTTLLGIVSVVDLLALAQSMFA